MSEAKKQQASEMVERVAEALVWIARAPTVARGSDELWATCERHEKVLMRAYARAVIAAMREPTKAMTEAACDAVEKYEDEVRGGDLTPTRHCLPETVWRAMIDEAVK